MWNPSDCKCEWDKSCGTGEYLDYKNCICRKNIVDRLIDECTNTIKESNDILVNSGNFPNSLDDTLHFSLFLIFLLLFLIIVGVVTYFYCYKGITFKRKDLVKSNSYTDLNLKEQVNY